MKIFVDGSKRAAVSRMFPIWKNLGHDVISNSRKADVQLSVVRIKNSHPNIVLRIDGVYYDKDTNYNQRNLQISKAHTIAKGVIYQSYLSSSMCDKYLDNRKTDIFDIIYNGIDKYSWNKPLEHNNINIICCAKWRRHKRLPETIDLFKEFLNYYPDSLLHIIGPMRVGAKKIQFKNVIYHGQLNFDQMIKIYQTGDISLHLSKKDSCPSSVVEAIAAGIPVVTTNACGGSTEMCNLTEGCIVVPGEDESINPDYIYKDPYNEIPKIVRKRLLKSIIKIAKEKRRVILPEQLTIKHVAKKYINIMEKVIHGPSNY